ncbi:MAG TPA: acylphosphatase [Planctomycetota bacterium]
MTLSTKAIRTVACFSGWVQGVGFRHATRELAGQYPVRGWVRNLLDGRVEVVVEGRTSDVERFLDKLRQKMNAYIQGEVVKNSRPTLTHEGFEIRS